MTTANYQFLSLYITLSCLITHSLSLETIPYSALEDKQYDHIEKVIFQKSAISLAGGIVEYSNDNLIFMKNNGKFKRAEFADQTIRNGGFISRSFSQDSDETINWNPRILNAGKFTSYNQDMYKVPRQDMISNQLSYYGMLDYSIRTEVLERYYIISLELSGGISTLNALLIQDQAFISFMTNPYNRLQFYLDLVRIWTVLAVDMKMRVCVGSPSTITVRIPDQDNPTYRPIFRHPEWSVNIDQQCEDYAPNYSSKSILINEIESIINFQRTIETFTLGRIIYYIEIMMAHQIYENPNELTAILDKFNEKENIILRDRTHNEETYCNKSLFEAHSVYRSMIRDYRVANPIENGDQNKAVNKAYEGMFDLLDTMVRENDFISGRPNWSDIASGFNDILKLVAPYYQERRLLLI